MSDKKNEDILKRLARAEGCVTSIFDLLNTAEDAHYECTLEGWLDEYALSDSITQEKAALRWMQKHYSSTAATTRAAKDLAEVVQQQLEKSGWKFVRCFRRKVIDEDQILLLTRGGAGSRQVSGSSPQAQSNDQSAQKRRKTAP